MSKEIHALKDRSGQIFWPATTTDAIIHPKTRSSLTDHIEKYNLTGDNTIDSLEDGIAKLVTLGISQHLGVQIEILNTSGILEEWTYYDPSKLFSNPSGWRRGGEVDDTLDATSENPVQNKVIYQALVENEEVIATVLNDLNKRVLQNKSDIDELEEVTTETLHNLDSRISNIEAGPTTGEVINFSETKYIDIVEGDGTDISSGDVSERQFTVTEDDYYNEGIDNFYPNLEIRYSTTGSGVVYIPLFPTGSNETLTFTSNQVRVGDYNYLAEIDNNQLNIRRTLAGTGSIRTLPIPNTPTPFTVGDTYDEAFGKIKKIISDNEIVTAAGLTNLDKRVVEITDTLTTKADLVDGKVPATQLPSYIDDVLEYEDLAHFPQEGENGKIYVALDSNLTYRWSGTAYVEISKSIVPYVIDLSSLNFGQENAEEANGVFEFGSEGNVAHDYYYVDANTIPTSINISEIIAAIDNKQTIYFTDDSSTSYLVTYSYKDITSDTEILLKARTIDNNSIYWINFWYSSENGLTIRKGSWPFRKDVNQIKNSIVILSGSIISSLLDPNAEVDANSYYAMDMGKFTSGSASETVLYTHQELYNILAGSTSYSSDANLIRPVLFFEGLDQVTSKIDLAPMQIVSVDFSLHSSASGQNLVLVAEGEEHKYTVEIEKDVTTKPINIITSDKDYSNQEISDLIEEVELVAAAGLNDLNKKVQQNKSDIDELEEVTSISLNELNERVEDLEDDVKNIEEIVDKGHLQKVKWEELKDLRDNAQLIPGYFYRITDYQCTAAQENTRSAGHQFDIVLLALSENKLAEEGWAMMHDNIYDVTFSDEVTKKCYLCCIDNVSWNIVDVDTLMGISGVDANNECTINENAKTALTDNYNSANLIEEGLTYNYFQNSNLSAWKIWYCLDNDNDRFAWACDDTLNLSGNPALENVKYIIVNGGTLYAYARAKYLDNDNGFAWVYADDSDGAIVGNINATTYDPGDVLYTKDEDPLIGSNAIDGSSNYYKITAISNGKGVIYRMIDEWGNDCPYDFKNIQFKRGNVSSISYSNTSFSTFSYNFEAGPYHYGVILDSYTYPLWRYTVLPNSSDYYYTFSTRVNNVIRDTGIYLQEIIKKNVNVTVNGFGKNKINPIGSNIWGVNKPTLNNNVFFGQGINNNLLELGCSGNTLYSAVGNHLSSNCSNNIIYGNYNNLGNSSSCNVICRSSGNKLDSQVSSCIIFNSNSGDVGANIIKGKSNHVDITGWGNIVSSYCTYIYIGNNAGNSCCFNQVDQDCHNISLFGGGISYNIFGQGCRYINFSNKSYYRYITVESGNQYITLNCTSTTSSSQYYQNVTIAKGTNTTTTTKTISDSNVNQDYQTIYKPANCQEISV